VDGLIVGGGVTGILAGYLLKKADRPHVEWLL